MSDRAQPGEDGGARRASLVRRQVLDKLRLRTAVHRYATDVLEALGRPPLMRDGDDASTSGVRTAEVGVDPVRILLFGGGIAVAYGVRSRVEAVDHPLALEIAAATGRGAVVENRAVEHVRIADTLESLGATGAHTFHAAVWCPDFLEGLERLQLRSWRVGLADLVQRLRADPALAVVLTGIPMPMGRHVAVVLARPWVAAVNRTIRRVAEEHPGVHYVETEPFVAREVGQPVTDAAYFHANALRISAAVLAGLGLPVRADGVAPRR